jgi:DNA invertase Pin-like site-specific DNA recombinase
MNANELNLTGPGAVYHRVSTDAQDTDRQKSTTKEWLARHGVKVAPEYVFEDLGWSRADARRRPAFQRMLNLVDDGRIKWIVVDRQDRFGTATKFELFAYLHRLVEAGCRLYTADDKDLTSLETADSLRVRDTLGGCLG